MRRLLVLSVIAGTILYLAPISKATIINVPSKYITIQAGDATGNCTTNGIDVVYLVAYLKGIGAPPVRPDCGEVIAGEVRPLNRGK
jgi:hypothetical protein